MSSAANSPILAKRSPASTEGAACFGLGILGHSAATQLKVVS